MRFKEQQLWDDLRNTMGNAWFARRIEDRLGAGLPDLFFAGNRRRGAWMELKVLDRLPAEARKFDIPKLEPEQRAFGLQMLLSGGANSWWLMTRCGDVDHLHRATIIDALGEINYSVFRNRAVWVGRIAQTPTAAKDIAAAILT